uniref:SFRICE_004408 n=1 Tax=Spodoptera frugiperda TaxID=7108 RepID=A0A2H1WL72_SPOFR
MAENPQHLEAATTWVSHLKKIRNPRKRSPKLKQWSQM